MGNAITGKKFPGTVSLILDPPPACGYVAGQTLTGSVYVQALAGLTPGVPLDLDCYLTGKEKSRVRFDETEHYDESFINVEGRREKRRKSRTVTRYRYAERHVVRMAVHLTTVTGGVEAGKRYRFPFEIVLPHGLPSTMRCDDTRPPPEHYGSVNDFNTWEGAAMGGVAGAVAGAKGSGGMVGGAVGGGLGGFPGGNGHCEVTYKVKAVLKGQGLFGDQHVQQPLIIRSAPLPPNPLPYYVPPISQDVTTCFCFGQGKITLGAKVDDTRIGVGEAATIDFACRNQSAKGITSVEAAIVESCTWYAGGHNWTETRTIATAMFRPTARWDALTKSKIQAAAGADEQHKTLQMIHEAINISDNSSIINSPPNALTSYQGALINTNHVLVITIKTEGMFTSNPEIKVPIHIGTPADVLPPEPLPDIIPDAPPEWADSKGDKPVETAEPVKAGESQAFMGGKDIKQVKGPGANAENDEEEDIVVPPLQEILEPTVQNLINELKFAVAPLSTVQYRLGMEDWKAQVFTVLTPGQYSSIVKAVEDDFDQPEVAVAIAPVVGNYTCDFVVACLAGVKEWLRISIVQKLVGFCTDLALNKNKIQNKLTEWERICTDKNFEEALKGDTEDKPEQ